MCFFVDVVIGNVSFVYDVILSIHFWFGIDVFAFK